MPGGSRAPDHAQCTAQAIQVHDPHQGMSCHKNLALQTGSPGGQCSDLFYIITGNQGIQIQTLKELKIDSKITILTPNRCYLYLQNICLCSVTSFVLNNSDINYNSLNDDEIKKDMSPLAEVY